MNLTKVDSEVIKLLSDITGENLNEEQITSQLVFLAALIMEMAGVIYADGKVTPKEEIRFSNTIARFINEEAALKKLTDEMIQTVRDRHLFTQTRILGILIERCNFTESEKLLLLALGYKIAMVDRVMDAQEKEYLERINDLRLKIDRQRLDVLEAAFGSQQEVSQTRLTEVKYFLEPQWFTELGDKFINVAIEIQQTIIDNLETTSGGERIGNNRYY